MAYPVRHFDPRTIYFITSRTQQSRFLMVPSDQTNRLIGGILARAVRQCEVELFAYIFTSNHFHLMVRAPSSIAMSRFMQRLQANIAIKVGRLVDWRGKFFGRRYSAEPIVDESAGVERLEYILSNGVKEGLVSAVQKWPGLSCVDLLLGGGRETHRWRDWTKRWKMLVHDKVNVDRFAEDCPSEQEALSLTPLPAWRHLSTTRRAVLVAKMVARIDAGARGEHLVLGAERIRAQDPHSRPRKSDHSARPKAHATSERWRNAVDRYRAVLAAFHQASRAWLAGSFLVQFPAHCFRPPAWTVPRIV